MGGATAVAARRMRGQRSGLFGACAVLAGWVAIFAADWRWWLVPRVAGEWLLVPGAIVVAAEAGRARWRSRWWSVGAVCFSAWWLAGAPQARANFWRVEFGAALTAWMLTRGGADTPDRGLATALTVVGGAILGGAETRWFAAALVMAAVCLGLLGAGRPGRIAPGLLTVGLVGAEIMGGRALRGGLGVLDLACLGAIGAPVLVRWAERRLRRRMGRAAGGAAAGLVAGALVGLAYAVALGLRGGR